jgi:hypothetical protein
MVFTCVCVLFVGVDICVNSVEYLDEIMNWKLCERKRSSPILTYNANICLAGLRKDTKDRIQDSQLPCLESTGHLLNRLRRGYDVSHLTWRECIN